MSDIVVFLGPTLAVDIASTVLDATYLPPVRAGDVLAALERRPEVICIIDGYFDHTPSVWHKEILHALDKGVEVFGASSMGALRAAELHRFGMKGVGAIFRSFADGTLEDDDEVAVRHGPRESGFRPLSDAMVNIREALQVASSRGLISELTRKTLTELAKATYYGERSWAGLFRSAPGAGVAAGELAALQHYVKEERPDLKRQDALELLRHVSTRPKDASNRPSAPRLHDTVYLQRLHQYALHHHRTFQTPDGVSIGLGRLCDRARIIVEGFEAVIQGALFRHWVLEKARQLDLEATAEEIGEAMANLPAAARSDEVALRSLAETQVLATKVAFEKAGEIEYLIPTELISRELFAPTLSSASLLQHALEARGIDLSTVDPADADLEAVGRWLENARKLLDDDWDGYLRRMFVPEPERFVRELMAEYLSGLGSK